MPTGLLDAIKNAVLGILIILLVMAAVSIKSQRSKIDSMAKENGNLSGQLLSAQTEVKEAEQEKARILKQSKLDLDFVVLAWQIDRDSKAAQGQIITESERLYRENPSVKDWADQPVPAEYHRLRDSQARGDLPNQGGLHLPARNAAGHQRTVPSKHQ